MKASRRQFIKNSSMAGIGFLGLSQLINQNFFGHQHQSGYGPLQKDPEGLLKLPKDFTYQIICKQGDPLSDGFLSPDRPDGMATFSVDQDRMLLIRNHEIDPGDPKGPYGDRPELIKKIDASRVYDFGSGMTPSTGGTTTLLYNEKTGKLEKAWLSLTGTNRNCAGGITPWGSWISCEENTNLKEGNMEKDHGFNFEVPFTTNMTLTKPVPLKDMGRFNHEAVCVDPRTSIVYQTEDRPDGLIYRYIPMVPEQLQQGGKLQVLAIKGSKSFDTRNWKDLTTPEMPLNEPTEVEWLDIDNVLAPQDDLRYRGFENGAARFARGEGMWFGEGELYFACTNGGKLGKGQVFHYEPSPYEGTGKENEAPGKLTLFLETTDSDILKNCDNLTISPWGDLVLCEDHPHPFVVGVTPQGECYHLAENVGFPSEFAGGVFSPSGQTYFVNIQDAGYTLAITGPWKKNA